MSYFIKPSDPKYTNAPINLDKVVNITKDYTYGHPTIYKLVFRIEKDFAITWNYSLEICRDSDYECIVNNMSLTNINKENEG